MGEPILARDMLEPEIAFGDRWLDRSSLELCILGRR